MKNKPLTNEEMQEAFTIIINYIIDKMMIIDYRQKQLIIRYLDELQMKKEGII